MSFNLKGPKALGLILACSILAYSWVGFAQKPEASVQILTEPSLERVSPLEAEATEYLGSGKYRPPVRLRLQAKDSAGAPLKDAQFNLKLLAPSPTPWFTTDFPIVEGTTLVEMTGNAPTGQFSMEQVFPIRGNYQLQVNVEPLVAGAFAPIHETLNLQVPENPLKLIYFPILLVILLAIGLGGGWIIGGRQVRETGEIAPRRVRLLLSSVTAVAIAALFFFNVGAELAEAHSNMPESPIMDHSGLIQSQGLQLELTGDDRTTVGQMAGLKVQLTDVQTNQPVSDVQFEIHSTQIEKNWVAFGYQGVPNSMGVFAWKEQFFDGAPHKIEVNVTPSPTGNRQFTPFQVTRQIEVEGIAPPMSVRLIGLSYFTIVLSIGVFLGIWIQRRRLSQVL